MFTVWYLYWMFPFRYPYGPGTRQTHRASHPLSTSSGNCQTSVRPPCIRTSPPTYVNFPAVRYASSRGDASPAAPVERRVSSLRVITGRRDDPGDKRLLISPNVSCMRIYTVPLQTKTGILQVMGGPIRQYSLSLVTCIIKLFFRRAIHREGCNFRDCFMTKSRNPSSLCSFGQTETVADVSFARTLPIMEPDSSANRL